MCSRCASTEASVFDRFPWWDPGDVLTRITPVRFSYIASVCGDLTGYRVLDLGCGGGLLAEPLRQAGADVIGIDISVRALQVARRHASEEQVEIAYLRSAAESLPFGVGCFDLVVAFDVLDHVSDLGKTIQEISRVLRRGGKLMYDTMNRTFLCRAIVIWIGENLWKGGPPKGTHDWRKFVRPEELVALLARNGFVNVETQGFIPKCVDRRGRLRMGLSSFKGLSYVGYGVKDPH